MPDKHVLSYNYSKSIAFKLDNYKNAFENLYVDDLSYKNVKCV